MAVANAAVPLLLSCALLFCGFILRKGSMPAYYLWVLKANVFHYSWGALMVNQYDQHRNALLGKLAGWGASAKQYRRQAMLFI